MGLTRQGGATTHAPAFTVMDGIPQGAVLEIARLGGCAQVTCMTAACSKGFGTVLATPCLHCVRHKISIDLGTCGISATLPVLTYAVYL